LDASEFIPSVERLGHKRKVISAEGEIRTPEGNQAPQAFQALNCQFALNSQCIARGETDQSNIKEKQFDAENFLILFWLI